MKAILDTHFLIWIVTGARRLTEYDWLGRYRPWGISPVSFLEIQFLAEVGKLVVEGPGFLRAVMADPRFVVDEVPLVSLVEHALPASFTRDPFDRLLVGHSLARRRPLVTADQVLLDHHALLPVEMRG